VSTVLASILAATSSGRVRASMALGALLEGGSLGTGPFGVGDQGTSFGPFQIHLPAHPGVSAAQAQDPASAVAFMLPAYTAAAAQVPSSLWTSNPQQAAEQTAYLAERPAVDYNSSPGTGTVTSKWASVTSSLATGNLSAGPAAPPAPAGSGPTAAPAGLLPSLPSIPSASVIGAAITKALTIAAVVAAGAGMVILGVNKAAGNPAGKGARAAAPVAAAAML
jgi:hypothetical protein